MYVQNFRSVAIKQWPLHSALSPHIQKGETGETWGKPKYVSRAPGSLLVSIQYRFVKQYSLEIITGLKGYSLVEKYWLALQLLYYFFLEIHFLPKIGWMA